MRRDEDIRQEQARHLNRATGLDGAPKRKLVGILQVAAHMEIPFNEDEYENGRREDLAERAFQEAMATFKRKTDRIQAI